MSTLTPAEAQLRLSEAVSLWRVEYVNADEIIDAATECLVAGVDSPTLRVLAGASARESRFVLEPMIEQTLLELGVTDDASVSSHRAALTTMLRRFTAGEMTARDLAKWAHKYIGHEGDADLQMFVDLDDMYDTVDYSGYSEADLIEWVREEAEAFLEGRPSPGRTHVWRTADPPVPAASWPARLFARLRRG